ncbi:MAG: DUF393 domain-containing protein [Akkermansiaceae bacterium]|nr:DUF393 domain-containing protein [Akkermansiaceae bacterium]NNM30681.1 DUF393 domain-containing protein [Akkermansiaceae bacterium]
MDRETIVFFDAECLLCNRAVRWMARHDPRKRLAFAPLDGETARAIVPAVKNDGETMLVARKCGGDWRVSERSQAVVEALEVAGGAPVRLRLLKLVPRPVRDLGYRLVAKSRYQVFGKIDHCAVPEEGLRERVLP